MFPRCQAHLHNTNVLTILTLHSLSSYTEGHTLPELSMKQQSIIKSHSDSFVHHKDFLYESTGALVCFVSPHAYTEVPAAFHHQPTLTQAYKKSSLPVLPVTHISCDSHHNNHHHKPGNFAPFHTTPLLMIILARFFVLETYTSAS